MQTIHVIGGGLSGLSAALSLSQAGRAVVVHEAGPAAGGRCRSYFDRELGIRVDNGNHLMLSGNRAVLAYLRETGAEDRVRIADRPVFPFRDLKTGVRWSLRPNRGRLPWWVLRPGRRVPDTGLADYLAMGRIVRIRDDTPVAEAMPHSRLYERLVEPLAIAALNTPPRTGLARLLAAVMRETLMVGGHTCRPILPLEGLSEAMVDPAVATLRRRGAEVRLNSRIAELVLAEGSVTALRGPDGSIPGSIPLGPADGVVLAVPPWVAADLLPGLTAPTAFEAILNLHFRHEADPAGPLGETGFIGLIGGTAEWLFRKPGHVSVTISAANALVDETPAALAGKVWTDVAAALDLPAPTPMPPFRVVKEKRATFAATAEQDRRRPGPRTALAANLAVAGDWTDTGLPATIEGAIRSGRTAANLLLSR
ncbi:MAG TPA: hydroxysqualene dehydroxylase HpnE [Rhodopila sp.]|uniref:hydroxysqualene dehydroxylase HpnE n=1 Tax=Rhodopila sp. TaxID=2480087 RepID=UPI002C7479FB|nr:hydroxysqualene dehydroxylase HpnE [Rhodopila sp.]HVY17701.1 hydroxysqualene dehydroxylase HpnE [Rhodopila sp.]